MRRDGTRELDDFEAVFAALAHETRRHVLVVLKARGGSMSAGDIAARFDHSWPTVTRHLGVLRDAGLVRVERRGRERVYHLDDERLVAVTDGWLRWFR
ncbi:MAG: helix-turn-helix transcriptional regulator [Alphaproteobacteria bacterium]|nr:helix-turn-helix transcriptional regulator [Alphaproteobacteria bacterium]